MDRSSRSEVLHNTLEMPTDCRSLSVSASVGQLMSVGHLAVHAGVQLSVSLASRQVPGTDCACGIECRDPHGVVGVVSTVGI